MTDRLASLRGERVVVTGGAGFIGSHLVDSLVGIGAKVVVVDDLSTGAARNLDEARASGAVTLHEGDIADAPLAAWFVGASRVFHLAARVSVAGSVDDPAGTERVNVEGTRRVAEAAQEVGAGRLIVASSSAIYGDAGAGPIDETQALAPASPYARSKRDAERAADAAAGSMDTVHLRLFNVYGPRQRDDGPYAAVVARFCAAAREGRPLVLHDDGEQTRDFVHVRDAVRAFGLAAAREGALGGTALNIGSGHATSVRAIAELVRAEVPGSIERAPQRPGDVRHSRAATHAARATLGFSCDTQLAQGIAELLAEPDTK